MGRCVGQQYIWEWECNLYSHKYMTGTSVTKNGKFQCQTQQESSLDHKETEVSSTEHLV